MLPVLERLIDCVTVLQTETPTESRNIDWCDEFAKIMLDANKENANDACRRMTESDCKTEWEMKWLFMPSRKSQGFIITHITATGRQCTLYFGIADNHDYMLPKEQKNSIEPRIFVYTAEFRTNPADISQYSWVYGSNLGHVHSSVNYFRFELLKRYIQFTVLSHWLLDFLYENNWHTGSVKWLDENGKESNKEMDNKYDISDVEYSACSGYRVAVQLKYKIASSGNDHVVGFNIYFDGVKSDILPDNMVGLMTLLRNGKEYDDGLDDW